MTHWLRTVLTVMGFRDLLPPLQTARPVPHRVPLVAQKGGVGSPKKNVAHRRTDNTTHAALALARERHHHPTVPKPRVFDSRVAHYDARVTVERDKGLRDLNPDTPPDSE